MKCAQCEDAQATLRCVDEDLYFCALCSEQLHTKRARLHHEIKPIRAAIVCDECEDASAEVECFECGGFKTALVFCLRCSASLHSRAARVGHRLNAIGRLKKQGREKHVAGRVIVDLTDFDSEEENHIKVEQETEDGTVPTFVGKTRVKKEAREGEFTNNVPGKTIKGRVSSDVTAVKSGRTGASTRVTKSTSQAGRQSEIASLIKLKDIKNVKEESPEKRQRTALKGKPMKTSTSKKKLPNSAKESSSSGSDNNESDDEHGGVYHIKRGSVSLEAFVVDADDQEDGEASGGIPEGKVEAGIKKRIKNMLELGLHPDTPEFEAQQALKNAQRLLTKHNLQQAEVLKGNLTDTNSLIGGMRVVELRAKGKTKHGRMEAWVQELGWVIGDNFDCQYFFKAGTSSKPLRVVFYGIRHNADCAGYAFAATFNRITIMSAAYVAAKTFVDDKENQDAKLQQINKGIYTRVARTNYRKGIVAGLKEAVKSAQRMRKESVSRYERNEPALDTCNNADESACESDEEKSFHTHSSSPSPNPKYEDDVDDDISATTRVAERCMAITALVMHSQKVGDEFLKQKGIKIRKRSVQHRQAAWNAEAFDQGKIDAERIDINQKSITAAKVKKPRRSGK